MFRGYFFKKPDSTRCAASGRFSLIAAAASFKRALRNARGGVVACTESNPRSAIVAFRGKANFSAGVPRRSKTALSHSRVDPKLLSGCLTPPASQLVIFTLSRPACPCPVGCAGVSENDRELAQV